MKRLLERLKKDRERMLHSIEHYTVTTKDGWPIHLLRRRPAKTKTGSPLLLIHGFGQNRYTWEPPASNFAPWFALQGIDTWIVELRGSGRSKKPSMRYDWTFEDFLTKDLPAAVEHIRQLTGGRRIFMCGHSLGGTLIYCYAALRGRDLRGFISLGGPVIYGRNALAMKVGGVYASLPEAFGLKPVVEYLPFFPLQQMGHVAVLGYPFLSTPFEPLIPLHPWHRKNVSAHRIIPRILLGFEKVSRKLAAQLVMWVSREGLFSYDLKTNYLKFLPRIKTPCLLIAGDVDRLAPPASIEPAFEAIKSKDKTFVILSPKKHKTHWGHLDLTMGKNCETVLFPLLLNWIVNH